jgi:metallophosphoesterase superfamily enzyme
MSGTKLVMGHVHPSVQLTDSIGARSNEKCWVRANFRKKKVLERFESCPQELVVVPAFNPLLTGTPINAGKGTKLGPIFRNQLVDESKLNIYLLDGSNLGAVGKV